MRFFLLLTFFLSVSLFALVSIAPVDIGSKPGNSGNVAGTLSAKSGNTRKEDYSLSLRLQHDQGKDYLVWGNVTYDYGTSNGVKNEDRTYAHLRYIHALDGSDWCAEVFAQSEQDNFKEIQARSLGGIGGRWRFFNSPEWGRGYLGIGGFREAIRYSNSNINPNEDNTRINQYIAYTKNFLVSSKISYIGYYQPKLDEGSDYVTSQTLELSIPIYGTLNLSVTGKYNYDSTPPIEVVKRDASIVTSLVWEF